jgi:hypothetical protein
MSSTARFVHALTSKVAIPLAVTAGVALHAFTVLTAYSLADSRSLRIFATVGAYLFPPFSELVVGYCAWRSFGSVINEYSIWVLLWLLLVLFTMLLYSIDVKVSRKHAAP